MPRSRKHGLVVSISPKRGLHVYFQKKASAFNNCIGDILRRGKPANRAAAKEAFSAAVRQCAGKPRAR